MVEKLSREAQLVTLLKAQLSDRFEVVERPHEFVVVRHFHNWEIKLRTRFLDRGDYEVTFGGAAVAASDLGVFIDTLQLIHTVVSLVTNEGFVGKVEE